LVSVYNTGYLGITWGGRREECVKLGVEGRIDRRRRAQSSLDAP